MLIQVWAIANRRENPYPTIGKTEILSTAQFVSGSPNRIKNNRNDGFIVYTMYI